MAEYTGISSDVVVAGGSGNGSENKTIAYIQLCETVDKRLTELYVIQTEVINAIATVPASWKRQLLYERFINNKNLDELGYSTPSNAQRALHYIANEIKRDI